MKATDRAVLERARKVMEKRNLPIGMTVFMPRICAVRGLPYAALYREKDGLWTFGECVRAAERGSGGASQMAIRWDTILGSEREICPWCNAGVKIVATGPASSIHCSKCSRDVCVGRCFGSTFQCCDACGAVGDISGSTESSVAFAMSGATANGARQARIGKPSAPRLMLTSGTR
jgi:hypothetical protein